MKGYIIGIALAMSVFIAFNLFGMRRKEQHTNGLIRIKLTDSPASYAALYVEVIRVELYGQDSGWITINDQFQVINILSLTNGNDIEIAEYFNPAEDRYTAIRISFGMDNSLYTYNELMIGDELVSMENKILWKGENQVEIPIKTPLYLDEENEILLDFNVMHSVIKEDKQFFLKPVITVMEHPKNGIEGSWQGASGGLVIASNQYREYSAYLNSNGNFLLRGLEPGDYKLSLYAGLNSRLNQEESELSFNVMVKEGEITDMGTVPYSSQR